MQIEFAICQAASQRFSLLAKRQKGRKLSQERHTNSNKSEKQKSRKAKYRRADKESEKGRPQRYPVEGGNYF